MAAVQYPEWDQALDIAIELRRESPATRLRSALAACNWSVRHVAPLINWDERTIRHWLSGRYEPPDDVLAWVESLAEAHTRFPPPPRRRATPPTQEPKS